MKLPALPCIFILFVLHSSGSGCAPNESKIEKLEQDSLASASVLDKLQGSWAHEEDSLAMISISSDLWTFQYNDQHSINEDQYKILVTDTIPEFGDSVVKAYVPESGSHEYIILLNPADTLYYEVFGITGEKLSLLYYPTGRHHVYHRKK